MRYFKTITILVLLIFVAVAVALSGGCMKKPAPKPLPGTPGAVTKPPRMVVGYY